MRDNGADHDSHRLTLSAVNAFYGSAHVLHDLTCDVGAGITAIVGRNGMGKTTLCKAIMGMTPPRTTGSIEFDGKRLQGKASHAICQAGLAYVPQGRRIFPSLSTREHLRMISPGLVRRGPWSIEKVYELFPRLAERRDNGGALLSGGEQQMLAIGRALLTNPALLVMDEPSEGLAPTIIDQLSDTCRTLAAGGMSILLVEQNLTMALSLADRLLVMVGGQIRMATTAAEFAADAVAQQRFLGVQALED